MVQTYFGGQAQGSALADVLFGDVNPSGRLPLTYPRTERDVPVANPWTGIANLDVRYREGADVGYRGYEKAGVKPLFTFGYGLSYTRFAYRKTPHQPIVKAGRRGALHVSFTVTNAGPRAGIETAQVYVRLPRSSGQDTKRLAATKRVKVQSRETKTIRLTLRPSSPWRPLSYYSAVRGRWVTPHGTFEINIATSATDTELSTSIHR